MTAQIKELTQYDVILTCLMSEFAVKRDRTGFNLNCY